MSLLAVCKEDLPLRAAEPRTPVGHDATSQPLFNYTAQREKNRIVVFGQLSYVCKFENKKWRFEASQAKDYTFPVQLSTERVPNMKKQKQKCAQQSYTGMSPWAYGRYRAWYLTAIAGSTSYSAFEALRLYGTDIQGLHHIQGYRHNFLVQNATLTPIMRNKRGLRTGRQKAMNRKADSTMSRRTARGNQPISESTEAIRH